MMKSVYAFYSAEKAITVRNAHGAQQELQELVILSQHISAAPEHITNGIKQQHVITR